MLVVKPSDARRVGQLLTAAAVRGVPRRREATDAPVPAQHAARTSARCSDDDRRGAASRICSSRIPAKARLSRPLALPPALAETDLDPPPARRWPRGTPTPTRYACFLGAGAYDHYVPSPINHLILRGEFFTAYTPYQPEASQGTLRTIYEYQTMIAELTGMDVANASIYDGASSLAEAALMAHADHRRAPRSRWRGGVHPLYRRVVDDLLRRARASSCATCPRRRACSTSTPPGASSAARPRRWSCSRRTSTAASRTSRPRPSSPTPPARCWSSSADPVNLGVLEAPGRLGADIVVGEGQGLGVPLSFGGPYLGVFAAKNEFVRRMPGPARRRHRGPGRQARLRADAADARAAHPPRQGDLEHLHQRRAVRADGDDLPGHARQAGAGAGRASCRPAKAHYAAERLAARARACRCASPRRSSRSSR